MKAKYIFKISCFTLNLSKWSQCSKTEPQNKLIYNRFQCRVSCNTWPNVSPEVVQNDTVFFGFTKQNTQKSSYIIGYNTGWLILAKPGQKCHRNEPKLHCDLKCNKTEPLNKLTYVSVLTGFYLQNAKTLPKVSPKVNQNDTVFFSCTKQDPKTYNRFQYWVPYTCTIWPKVWPEMDQNDSVLKFYKTEPQNKLTLNRFQCWLVHSCKT